MDAGARTIGRRVVERFADRSLSAALVMPAARAARCVARAPAGQAAPGASQGEPRAGTALSRLSTEHERVVLLLVTDRKANTNMTKTSHNNSNSLVNGPGPSESGNESNFIALNVAYQLIRALARIVPLIARTDRDLADQIQRAATSVALNLAEGQRSMKGNRHKHYAIAHGSANEVKAGLFVAQAWGWIEPSAEALALLDRLLALLWKLTHVGATPPRG